MYFQRGPKSLNKCFLFYFFLDWQGPLQFFKGPKVALKTVPPEFNAIRTKILNLPNCILIKKFGDQSNLAHLFTNSMTHARCNKACS